MHISVFQKRQRRDKVSLTGFVELLSYLMKYMLPKYYRFCSSNGTFLGKVRKFNNTHGYNNMCPPSSKCTPDIGLKT